MKRDKKNTSVYFIVPAPIGISPGQRFRFEQYLPFLENQGIKYKISPYLSLRGRKALYTHSNTFSKIRALSAGYFRRITDLFKVLRYDYVYIHREDVPFGPAIFSWFFSKVWRKKLIYDFDDAIWLPLMSDYNKKYSFIKFWGNVSKICKWSHVVTVGNEYLKNYASSYNKNVTVIPTVVDTQAIHNRLQNQDTERAAVGWTGSFSTLTYLNMVLPVLQQLQKKFDFTFYVIADVDPQLPLKNYRFIQWRKETEVVDLLNFHIGIMPLADDEFSKGKCGFKAIQYMSLGIPALVSPVGVNTQIITDGVDGFICRSDEEWKEKVEQLLTSNLLRKKMGEAARKKIEKNYSVNITCKSFLALFNDSTSIFIPFLYSLFLW